MKRNNKRMKESFRGTYYQHHEGISDLVNYIADTLDEEAYGGSYIASEMMSLSGDECISLEENAMQSVDINMSIFGVFDMLYFIEADFNNSKVQKNYEKRLNQYIDELAEEGITEDDPDFEEELDTISYTDYVGVDIDTHIKEYDDETDITFTLTIDGIKIDNDEKSFSNEEILNGDYEKWVTKTIQEFYNEV